MKSRKFKIGALSALSLVFVASCADDDASPVVAQITTSDDTVIEFYQLEETGAMIVSEVGPAEVPSKLAGFAVDNATPLEIYLALAQGEDVPIELELHHASVSDAEPRDLSTSFRSISGSVAAGDCTLTGDAEWFDDYSDWLGWTDTDYWSGTAAYHFLYKGAANMLTHLCNYEDYSGTTAMKLQIQDPVEGVTFYTLNGIDPGERGVVVVSGASPFNYRSSAMGPLGGQTNTFRHGYMVP